MLFLEEEDRSAVRNLQHQPPQMEAAEVETHVLSALTASAPLARESLPRPTLYTSMPKTRWHPTLAAAGGSPSCASSPNSTPPGCIGGSIGFAPSKLKARTVLSALSLASVSRQPLS